MTTKELTGRIWTRFGDYNYAIYYKGDVMEACNGSPIASQPTIVCWYPGKPTLTFGYTGHLNETIQIINGEPYNLGSLGG